MKKRMQLSSVKVFFALVLALVFSLAFASGAFAMIPPQDFAPARAVVPTGDVVTAGDATPTGDVVSTGGVASVEDAVPTGDVQLRRGPGSIDVNYAPTVTHTTIGGDPLLYFPYRLNLVGGTGVISFNLYIVDTVTREIVTAQSNVGTLIMGAPAPPFDEIQTSARGDFIQVTSVPSNVLGRVEGQATIFLRHGQEVIITTNHALVDTPSSAGLLDFGVLSYFWVDEPLPGFTPTPDNPGPTAGFGPVHRDYTFHLENPDPTFIDVPGAPPPYFHSGFTHGAAAYIEGFVHRTVSGLPIHIQESNVRIEAVWTFRGEPVLPLMKNFAVPEGIILANAPFNFDFEALEVIGVPDAVMPPITGVGATFTNIDTTGPPALAETFVYNIADVLAGIDFTQAGVHVYRVSEVSPTVLGLPEGQSVNYSLAEFIVEITVEEAENNNVLFVSGIVIRAVKNDAGEEIDPAVVVNRLTFNNALCVWGDWIVTTPPTCCAPGVETRTCSCGKTETRPVPPVGCNWSDWAVVTEPNCVTPGEERRECLTCAELGCNCCPPQTRPIPPTPCTWGSWTVVTEPNCVTPGLERRERSCDKCTPLLEEREIPATPCDWGQWRVVTAANCVTPGQERRDKACDKCDDYETRVIPATPCDWGQWTVVTRPNCVIPGLERRTKDCDKCNDYQTRPIPPSPCEWGDWVVTRPPGIGTPGEERREKDCDKCDDYETRPIPPLAAPEICDVCEQDPCVCDPGTQETTPTVPVNDDGERRPAPGPKTGDTSNPTMHLLHMLAAALLSIALAYRLACSSELSLRRRAD